MKKKKTLAYFLLIIGFIIIIINAADYLGGFFGLSSDVNLPSSAIGIILIALGASRLKKLKS